MINAVFIALPDTFLQSIDLYPPIACFLSSKFVSPDVPLSLFISLGGIHSCLALRNAIAIAVVHYTPCFESRNSTSEQARAFQIAFTCPMQNDIHHPTEKQQKHQSHKPLIRIYPQSPFPPQNTHLTRPIPKRPQNPRIIHIPFPPPTPRPSHLHP